MNWPTSTSRRPSWLRSATAADSARLPWTVRTLFERYVGIRCANPKNAQLVPTQAGHHLVGRRAAEGPVEVADGQRALHRRGAADERLWIQLIADAQLAPDALRPGRVLLERAERPVAVVQHHADAAG